jgi:hypothetical protein
VSSDGTGADTPKRVEYIGNGFRMQRTRARLLAEIEGLPDEAFITARHAAAYIDTTRGQMANWRMQRRGPPFVGGKGFIRYKLSDLKSFMAQNTRMTDGARGVA